MKLGGKIEVAIRQEYDDFWKNLYQQEDFLAKIRSYNNMFAFASVICDYDVNTRYSLQTAGSYIVHGQVYHKLDLRLPKPKDNFFSGINVYTYLKIFI